jgi:probable HAF family extracellular repeat protein
LIPPSEWILQTATDINDAGQIVASGINAGGQTHAFRLDPIIEPEPSTLALLFVGGISLLGYGVWRHRRRRMTAT